MFWKRVHTDVPVKEPRNGPGSLERQVTGWHTRWDLVRPWYRAELVTCAGRVLAGGGDLVFVGRSWTRCTTC